MARDAVNQAKQTYQQSQNLQKQSATNANNLYGTLIPAYTNEAVNPQGIGTQGMTAMTTAAQQSAGGSQGAARGKANEYAAANRNTGSFAPVLDESAREAGRNLGQSTLDINAQNEMLKQQQRQAGLEGLSSMYGVQNNDVLSSLGLQNQSTQAQTAAGAQGWFQNMTNLIGSLRGAGYQSPGQTDSGASTGWAVTA